MPSCDFNNFDNCSCLDCKREREIWKEKIEKQKELIIYECNYYKALTLMEKIKEWRTERLNNYLINTEEGKKILQSIMKLKLSLTKYIYCC